MWPEGSLHGPPLDMLNELTTDDIACPLVYGLIQVICDNGDAKELEEVGDRLTARVQSTPTVQEPFQAIRLAHLAYLRAFDIESEARAAYLAAKALSLEIVLAKFELEDDNDESVRTRMRKSAEQLAHALLGSVAGQGEAVRLQAMLGLAAEARGRNLQLALSLADWVSHQTSEFDFGARADPGGVVTALATTFKLACLERMVELERSLGLDWIPLERAEEAAYFAAFAARQAGDARRLADDVLSAGDRLAARLDDEERKLGLLDRLYKVSRITGDIAKISERVERLGRELRRVGRGHEQAGRWIKAADVYSNLGYRYFAAGEYTGLSRLYLLSVYYFEKSEVFRAKDPTGGYETDSDDPNVPEAGYRRLESEGFIYGASGRLAQPAVATDLFERAALALECAAKMVFGKLRLNVFYGTVSNFFDAHSGMMRVGRSEDLREICQLLADAAAAFHECGRGFQQVFSSYEAVLSRLVSGDPDPCPVGFEQELARTMHPDAEGVAEKSAAAAAALATGDVAGLRAAVAKLADLFIFLYPTG